MLYGDCTEKDRQTVDAWAEGSDKRQKFLCRLQSSSFREGIEQEAGAAQERIYLLVQEKIRRVQLMKKLRLWQGMSAAAIILLLIISGMKFTKNVSAPAIYVESKSPTGSTSRLTLSDGTIVELNAGSTISYPLIFQGENRTVTLTGEACFDVAHNAKQPFVVDTKHMKIKVLGTYFNIKAYEDDDKAIATLMKGLVNVKIEQSDSSPFKSIVLKSDQQVIFDKAANRAKVLNVNAELYASWKNGECFFENERMADIIKILSRQYGVKITIRSKKLENQLYSGFFSKQEGLFHILNSFKKNRNFKYHQTDQEIEIYEI